MVQTKIPSLGGLPESDLAKEDVVEKHHGSSDLPPVLLDVISSIHRQEKGRLTLKRALRLPDGESLSYALSNPKDYETLLNHLKAESVSNDNVARRSYCTNAIWLSRLWIILVAIIVLFSAMKPKFGSVASSYITITFESFALSDAVLITLLTTTTANVLGLMLVVSKYLFPQPTKSDKQTD